jgi:TRAP-type transport system periplasmic protein
MKKGIWTIGITLSICLTVLSFSAMAWAQGKAINLSVSSFFPPNHGIAKSLEAFGKEVEKRSNGKVTFTFYHSGSLSSSENCYEGVVKDISDMGQSVLAYTRGRFPLMEIIDMPGYPNFNAIITSRIADDVYRKFTPKELADTHVLFLHAHMPGIYYTVKKPVNTLEDMKGLRIRATGLSAKIVQALGATPVAMPKSDEYDALQKGVVDGTVGAPAGLITFRLAEITKYSTWITRAGSPATHFVVMNLKKWNSLPADVKKILNDVAAEWPEYTGKVWNSLDLEGVEFAKKQGHKFIVPSAEEGLRWEKALAPVYDDYIKSMQAKGLPGKEVFEYRKQLIDKYAKMYPSVKLQ